jgi:hypothetical protein
MSSWAIRITQAFENWGISFPECKTVSTGTRSFFDDCLFQRRMVDLAVEIHITSKVAN